jgi:hypothetical protein
VANPFNIQEAVSQIETELRLIYTTLGGERNLDGTRSTQNSSSETETATSSETEIANNNSNINNSANTNIAPTNTANTSQSPPPLYRNLNPATDLRLVFLGGDHSISYPILKVLSEQYSKYPITLLHFDSHFDTWDSDFGCNLTHGTPFKRCWEEGILNMETSMHVGIHGSELKGNNGHNHMIHGSELEGNNAGKLLNTYHYE